jgi:hypothetical protein
MSSMRILILGFATAATLTGCVAVPTSSQPEVDAAVLDSAEEFEAVITTLDGDECLTVIRLDPGDIGVSAAQVSEGFDLLRDAAAAAGCDPVVRFVTSDREPVDASHLPKYLDVEWIDGALHL